MEKNREVSLAFVVREDGASARERAEKAWEELGLAVEPAGLDYLLLDCCMVCGPAVATVWKHLLHGRFELGGDDGIDVVGAIKLLSGMRRRRAFALLEWSAMRSIWTNRLNRVVRRAEKMVV